MLIPRMSILTYPAGHAPIPPHADRGERIAANCPAIGKLPLVPKTEHFLLIR